MDIQVIGIDLVKSFFHIVGMDQRGKVVARKRFSRSQTMACTAKIPPCLIGMEACCGGHFIGAALTAQAHGVRFMPAQFVKPFLKSNKKNYLEDKAIAESYKKRPAVGLFFRWIK